MIQKLFPTLTYQTFLHGGDFPSSAAKKKCLNLNRSLLEEVESFKRVDKAGQEWSKKNYLGGYTSYASYDRLFLVSSEFDNLRKALTPHVGKFIKALDMDISINDLEMTHLWMNVMPSNVTHSMHIHPLSVISGTYYLQVPKGSGSLKIEDPRMDQFMNSPARKANAKLENQRHVHLRPQAGQLILFESWTRHEVPPNLGQGIRISISFNYGWKNR